MSPGPQTPAPAPPRAPRRALRIPYLLLAALGLYAVTATWFIQVRYWGTPEYQASIRYQAAVALLGPEDGRRSSPKELLEAYTHLLEAARLVPTERELHRHLERVHWRLEEIGVELPEELRLRSAAVASIGQRQWARDRPFGVLGARDRGWDPQSLLAGPKRVGQWAAWGGVLVVFLWASNAFGRRRQRARERDLDQARLEGELAELGAWREGLQSVRPRSDTLEDLPAAGEGRPPTAASTRPAAPRRPRKP